MTARQLCRPHSLAERANFRIKERFRIASARFGPAIVHCRIEPDRMHDELAVRALRALIDNHLCPSGLEVHVLPNLEFRLGWCCVDMRCAVCHPSDAHDGLAGSTGGNNMPGRSEETAALRAQ
jgi:hypothetical protein